MVERQLFELEPECATLVHTGSQCLLVCLVNSLDQYPPCLETLQDLLSKMGKKTTCMCLFLCLFSDSFELKSVSGLKILIHAQNDTSCKKWLVVLNSILSVWEAIIQVWAWICNLFHIRTMFACLFVKFLGSVSSMSGNTPRPSLKNGEENNPYVFVSLFV